MNQKNQPDFFNTKIKKIFEEKNQVIDIGGGLRISKNRGNAYDPNHDWINQYLNKVNYKILDPVDTYHPDIVGDIHHLPFADSSLEAIVCMSVLEHVKNPIQGVAEMYRVLKPGGYCYVHVPFLRVYHAEPGYYKDYWRFTQDTLKFLFKGFSHQEISPCRGAISTLLKFTPLGRYNIFVKLCHYLDILLKKNSTKQTSGYNVFLIK